MNSIFESNWNKDLQTKNIIQTHSDGFPYRTLLTSSSSGPGIYFSRTPSTLSSCSPDIVFPILWDQNVLKVGIWLLQFLIQEVTVCKTWFPLWKQINSESHYNTSFVVSTSGYHPVTTRTQGLGLLASVLLLQWTLLLGYS